MDQTLHTVATKNREEIKRTTKQKMARRHDKEGGNHLEQESNRQKTLEDTDGGLYPTVDEQSLGERRKWLHAKLYQHVFPSLPNTAHWAKILHKCYNRHLKKWEN